MSINEFDELIKGKFEQHEFAYKHAGWEQLSQQLPGKRDRFIKIPWQRMTGIAASVLVTAGAFAWYFAARNQGPGHIAVNTPVTASGKVVQQEKPVNSNASSANNTNNNTAQPLFPPPSSSSNPKNQKASEKNFTPDLSAPLHQDNQIAIITRPVVPVPEQKKTENSRQQAVPGVTPGYKAANTKAFPDDIAFEPVSRASGKTFVSLTGGLNYGSMNTGYMAGINAKQKLGNKVFVEGDLALVSNSSNQTFTSQQPVQSFAGTSLKGAPVDYKEMNFVYLQFNPTFGYQVLKNVSLGVGADLQKMMNNDNTLVNVDDQVRVIPGFDVGITGKTEVSVSKKLKAGILYREGINNFINSSNEYFDRRYLQLQLKFTVLGK